MVCRRRDRLGPSQRVGIHESGRALRLSFLGPGRGSVVSVDSTTIHVSLIAYSIAGWGYSGRLKYLQMCRSVIISHPMTFIQHFHHLFNTDDRSPHQNMIEVPVPLEEHLPRVMEELINDDERAERIASNSWSYLREHYLTPAAK
jgi:hypothetical protein